MTKPRLHLVGIAMVKNEQDVIECFVRYHLRILDEIVILDNGSSDATPRILAALRKEGLPVHLRYDPHVAYRQAEITTLLAQKAAAEFDADFVVVLDADEFLRLREPPGDVRAALEVILAGVDLAYIPWSTYVPLPGVDSAPFTEAGTDLLRCVRWRRRREARTVYKVIVSRQCCGQPGFGLVQGSHDVLPFGSEFTPVRSQLESIVLAHFPVRSFEQAQRKYLIGWLGNLALNRPALFDWALYYERFKAGDVVDQDITVLAYFYNCAERRGELDLVYDPVPVADGVESLYGEQAAGGVLGPLLSQCEQLAMAVGGADALRGRSWMSRDAFPLFDCTLAPTRLSLAEAAGLWAWIAPSPGLREVVVGDTGRSGGLSSVLRIIAETRDFDVQIVHLGDYADDGRRPGHPCIDRLVIHTGVSASAPREAYRAFTPALRPGGRLALFNILDFRDASVRNLADAEISPSALWEDRHLSGRFLFATYAPSVDFFSSG